MPKISIIIPIYNVESYLHECLLSVAKQTLTDIEVICIDDFSTDNSYETAKKFIETDFRFSLIRLSNNRGQSFARNIGIEKARGKYLYFLDSDDYLDYNAMEILYSYAEENNVQGIFFGATVIGESKENDSTDISYLKCCNRVYTGNQFFIELNKENEYQSAACMQFWKRSYIVESVIKFYEGIVYEDTLYTLQAILNARSVMCIGNKLYNYRKRNNSTTSRLSGEHLASYVIIYYEVLKLWMNRKNQREIEEGIRSRLNLFHRRINVALGYIGNVPEIKFKEEACTYLYKILVQTKPQFKYVKGISEEWECYIEQFSEIIVYGAGMVAYEVIELLQEKNKQIIGIAISNKKKEQDTYMGYPIKELFQWENYKETALIIVATTKIHHKEIKDNIVNAGFKNCIAWE